MDEAGEAAGEFGHGGPVVLAGPVDHATGDSGAAHGGDDGVGLRGDARILEVEVGVEKGLAGREGHAEVGLTLTAIAGRGTSECGGRPPPGLQQLADEAVALEDREAVGFLAGAEEARGDAELVVDGQRRCRLCRSRRAW